MLSHLRQYPLFVLVTMIAATAMMVPAAHAARQENWQVARLFFQYSLLINVVSIGVGVSMMNRATRNVARSNLMTLVYSFSVLPVILALPVAALVPSLGLFRAYFEMVSSATTTGATLFDDPFRVAEAIHLWRAIVAWMGGFLAILAAIAIMEPLNIGGYELKTTMAGDGDRKVGKNLGSERIINSFKLLAPAYGLFTALLTLILVLSGDRALIAFIHAMSTIATSGISPTHGLSSSNAGLAGEMAIFLFLFLAISSRLMVLNQFIPTLKTATKDPEIRLMLIIVIGIPVFLFLRHWFSALDVNAGDDLLAGLRAFWGAIFTVLSFLTTTGFESAEWGMAQSWSGLRTPGIIFFGLVVMGGGVATTAGGVKLLRIYALYKHSGRELERLVHPSSVGSSGIATRRFRRKGAEIAWIFLMLFLIGISVIATALAYAGLDFERAIALSIASLTNTGPVLGALGDHTASYSGLNDTMLGILSFSMVLGRLEALALIALFNPDYWRQ